MLQSFGCLRLSFILKLADKLLDVTPLLAFRVFNAASHTGSVIGWRLRNVPAEPGGASHERPPTPGLGSVLVLFFR